MTDRKLRIKQRSGYFCGMFGCNAAYSMVNTFLLMFYTDAMKLDAAQLSLMFLITKLVDGVTDYLVGCLIDRTDTKLGRNKPWMLYGIPVFVIGFLLVFAAPDFAASWRLAYAYLSYSIFCFGFTMVYVPMNSIVPFMTSDPDERTTILTYGNVGGSVGVLLAIVGVPAMIQINGGTSSISGYTRTALPLITISAAIYFLQRGSDQGRESASYGKERIPLEESAPDYRKPTFPLPAWLHALQCLTAGLHDQCADLLCQVHPV